MTEQNTANPNRSLASAVIREQPYFTGTINYKSVRDDKEHRFALDTRWSGSQTLAMRRLLGVSPDDVMVSQPSVHRGRLAVGIDTLLAWTIAAGVASGYRWTQTEVDDLLDMQPSLLGEFVQFADDFELTTPDGADIHDPVGDGDDPTAPASGGQSG